MKIKFLLLLLVLFVFSAPAAFGAGREGVALIRQRFAIRISSATRFTISKLQKTTSS